MHIDLSDLWEAGYPYYFHVDYPALDDQHARRVRRGRAGHDGRRRARTSRSARRRPIRAVAPTRARSGSSAATCRRSTPAAATTCVDDSCPWIKLDALTAAQGYRIDGAKAGDGLGSSLASVGDQNGDGIPDLAIGASAASPDGRSSAGEVVVVAGQHGSATRDLATAPPLQQIDGAMAGAGLGASIAAAGDVDGDGHVDLLAGAPGEGAFTGAAYLLRGAPNTVTDLALVPAKIIPAGAGAQAGSSVAAGLSLDGIGRRRADRRARRERRVRDQRRRDAQPADPAGGRARRAGRPAPPATTPLTPPVTTPVKPPVVAKKPKKKKLALCPLKPRKATYRVVSGVRVKVKPAPCRARVKLAGKVDARAMARVEVTRRPERRA